MIDETAKGNWAYHKAYENCIKVDTFKWHFVNGWTEFLNGIKLLPCDGHVDGQQAVLVDTGGVSVLVAGDAANSTHNLQDNIPSGIYKNIEQSLKTYRIIKMFADEFIGAHEMNVEIKPFQTSGFPKVPKNL